MEIMTKRFNAEITEAISYDREAKKFHFDEAKCIQLLVAKGKKIYGDEFAITRPLTGVYKKIMSFAINDRVTLEELQINPQKGLFLLGAPYTGKTAIMHLCKVFFAKKNNYQIYNVKKLTCDFAQKGYAALEELLILKYPICLDGIGEEKAVKYYGNNCDVVPEIVEMIYNQRQDFKYPMLHLTSRLNINQLEERYGESFRMMVKELTNGIILN